MTLQTQTLSRRSHRHPAITHAGGLAGARRMRGAFLLLTGILLTAPTLVLADDEIDIDHASWSSWRNQLTVRGDNAPDNAIVTIRYGKKDDRGAVIGTTEADGDGDWAFSISSLNPVPCEVTAQAGGSDDDDKEVRRAPRDCSNDGDGVVQPPPANVPPTANANGPYTGTTGIVVSFSSAGSNGPDGSSVTYSWDFGDGGSSTSANPSHTYTTAGTYNVTLTVTDNGGDTDSDTTTATITDPAANVPPVANANGPYIGTTDVAVSFSSAGSNDPDGSSVTYSWDFGDGGSSTSANPSHTYTTAGTYNVTLTVTDNGGDTDSDTTTATITDPAANVPPVANANGPYIGTTDVAVSFSSAGSNDPDGSSVTYSWDFGDGNTSTQANPSYTYQSAGNYTVSLTVTDNAGDTGTDSTTTSVTDPVVCTSPIQDHCSITEYTGPEVCVDCHVDQARDMHGSVHYQQGGAFPNVTNIDELEFAAAGERPAQAANELVATGVNTYCGTHENSPRFTCAGCHVGNGRFPMAQSEFEQLDPASQAAHDQLANIDCLMCHQEGYKRFPDWLTQAEGGNGYGFIDLILLNVEDDGNGNLVELDGAKVERTGFAGIPNVDPVTGDFQFMPAGIDTLPDTVPMAPMALTTLEAAQNVHLTTRKSCLNCHAGAAGGDGTKRGDLSKENADPHISVDMHMSTAGANLTCSDCHSETLPDGTGHRLRGRGLDLRPNDVAERFTCEGCHQGGQPHGDFSNTNPDSKDRHAQKIACQTCHIPSYAKAAVGTEVARDWQDPHPSAAACNGRGGWLPREDKGGLGSGELIPSYAWFDGTSEIYYLGEKITDVPTVPLDADVAASFVGDFQADDPAYVIGMPNGDVTSTSLGTKLYPMKEHWGKLARNDVDNTLVGHSTFEFFRTGSFCRAVAVGLGLDEVNDPSSSVCNGLPGDTDDMPPNTTAVAVHTYQTINHGVETSGSALGCNDCHGSTARMDLQGDLGYALKGPEEQVCTQCHGSEDSMSFNGIHDRHVEREQKDCSVCHTFSRPERGLSTTTGRN